MQLHKNIPPLPKSQRGKERGFGEASVMAFLKMRGSTVDIHNWFSLFWFLVPMRGEVFIPSDNNNTQHHNLTIFSVNLNTFCFDVVTPLIFCQQQVIWSHGERIIIVAGKAEQMNAKEQMNV